MAGQGETKDNRGDNKQPQQTILNKKQKRGKYTTQGRKEYVVTRALRNRLRR